MLTTLEPTTQAQQPEALIQTPQCENFTACKAMMEAVLNLRSEITSFACPNIPDHDCELEACNGGSDCPAE
jgi:hypothetical protein